MGLETPRSGFGGTERDGSDYGRLRFARNCDLGFPVGRYLQPPPMVFTPDGHNVFLGDMYRGHPAFLICAGPSLTSHDLSQLDQRGILTCAVNNAATVYRPNIWTSIDDPGNFADAIWYDPAIMKFVPLGFMDTTFRIRGDQGEFLRSPHRVRDMPAVFGVRRNETFNAEQWLYEDSFNYGQHSSQPDPYGFCGGRSVMLLAVRLLFYLGVRRIFLLGCDFRMVEGKANYAFTQYCPEPTVRRNNETFQSLNVRFEHLRPHFAKEDLIVLNCTPNSGLTAFPSISFDDAVKEAAAMMPTEINPANMYDRRKLPNYD